MGGFFGVVAKDDCVSDLYYGTDYHSHLGTQRGGLAVRNAAGVKRIIHDITNAQFRSKFDDEIGTMHGNMGIGVISDYEDQPLLIRSHLGFYSIVTVSAVGNLEKLAERAYRKRKTHFTELRDGELNPTEVVSSLINQEDSFEAGIANAQKKIEGSCSILLLTEKGIYAARDKLGRTPIVVGRRDGAYSVTSESCALHSLDYSIDKYLGPGETIFLDAEGYEQRIPPGERLQICSFLWVYYGYPASDYEDINVESVRNRCGAALARNETAEIDLVAGIPDSGTGHGLGYASAAKLPYRRPFVKYTPTWPRSFMPQNQDVRDLVARMKLIPIRDFIEQKRLLFCEDSIVRGTQLKDTISRLYDWGAREVHMRPACPPLVFKCKFLNFSRSKSEMDLAARKGISELGVRDHDDLSAFVDSESSEYREMIDRIRVRLGLTTLRYQRLDDLVEAIGLPKERLCTYCWDGAE